MWAAEHWYFKIIIWIRIIKRKKSRAYVRLFFLLYVQAPFAWGGLRFRRRKHYLVLIYKMIVFKQILDYRSLKFIKGSMEGQLVNYWKLHFCKLFSVQQL